MADPDYLKLPPYIRKVSKRIAAAASGAIDAYASEKITDEPSITDRWIGAVENELKKPPRSYGRKKPDLFSGGLSGITWEAMTLRSASGSAAEERRHGADLLGVAEIHVGGNSIKYGFLGQAKRIEPGEEFNKQQWNRLRQQAELMLMRSPASFVLAYSKRLGIRFVPAISVASFERPKLFDFNSMELEQFFQLHFASYIGDHRLYAPHIKTVDDLMQVDALHDFPIQHFLQITLRVHG